MANPPQKQKYNYLYYGTKTTVSEVRHFIEHILQTNDRSESIGRHWWNLKTCKRLILDIMEFHIHQK